MSGNTQRAAVALRGIIVGGILDDDDTRLEDCLEGVNTSTLPNGALAYVVSDHATYRLDKNSVTAGTTGSVIVPNSGPGRWLLQPGSLADERASHVTGTSLLAATTPTIVVVQNTWIALPSGSDFYQKDLGPGFPLNTTTGVLTYAGVSGQLFRVTCSATLASATAADVVGLAISHNGSLIGTVTFSPSAGVASVDTTTPALGEQLTTEVMLTLSATDTLQAVMRNESGAHNMTATHLNMSLTPV